jgi:hypothetical protein
LTGRNGQHECQTQHYRNLPHLFPLCRVQSKVEGGMANLLVTAREQARCMTLPCSMLPTALNCTPCI